MKKVKGVIASVLVVTMMFSLTSCCSVKKIDDKDLEDAFEDVFDWDEDDNDYYESDDYEKWATNFDDPDDPFIYDLDQYISGYDSDDDGYMSVSYCVFEDSEDADEYFGYYYEAFAAGDKEVEKSYHAGRNGYYISYNEKDRFFAVYFCDDMIIEVTASGDDYTKQMNKFLKTLGLPH